MSVMITKPSYGVLVARVQTSHLHEGHLWLLKEVQSLHSRVILFLGTTPIGSTYKNPLDFETRRLMVQELFPNFNVLPLPDMYSDEAWSRNLDNRIRELADYGDVTLYGSRDSFIPHYKGSFTPVELTMPHALKSLTGTEIRANLTNEVRASADFRAGVIHAMTNIRPSVKATVDAVIFHRDASGRVDKFLLAQKPGETLWRFVGGFSEPTTPSYEFDVVREAMEETGLEITNVKFIGSMLVPDWRWLGEPDQIKTSIFAGESMTLGGTAMDDIANLKWHNIEDLDGSMFSTVHKGIFQIVYKHFEEDFKTYNRVKGKAQVA